MVGNHSDGARRALGLALVALALVAWALPPAAADEVKDVTVPAPADLDAAGELLGFGSNPLVDECNTFHVPGTETWSGFGDAPDGEFTRATHNAEDVPTEMLERALLEHENEDWTDIFGVAQECAKNGGWCACAAISLTGRAVFCAACCPEDTAPFCVCDGFYFYAYCGCYQV